MPKPEKEAGQNAGFYRRMFSLLERMCHHAPDMIWAKDLKCRYLFANRAICERLLIAKDPYEPIGKTDLYFAHRQRQEQPENPEWHTFGQICVDSDHVVLNSGKPGRFEEFGNVQGRFLLLDVHKVPLFDENGEMVGTVGCARDITEERKRQKEFVASEALYRAVLMQSHDAIVLLDRETLQIVETNPRFSELTGYRLNAGSRLDAFQLFDDSPENLRRLHKEICTNGSLPPTVRKIRRADGTTLYVNRSGSLIQAGERQYLLISLRDLTIEMELQLTMQKDLVMASEMQRHLLPKLPKNSRFEVETVFAQQSFVSGDWYHLEWDEGRKILYGFLIDVTGHGMTAALQTASMSVLVHEVMDQVEHLPVSGRLAWLNLRVPRYVDEHSFAAAMAFELDFAAGELRYSSAGITDFLFNGLRIPAPGLMLGINATESYTTRRLPLRQGDSVCFMTDGISDLLTQNGLWEQFAAVNVCESYHAGKFGGVVRDDATAVCIRVKSL